MIKEIFLETSRQKLLIFYMIAEVNRGVYFEYSVLFEKKLIEGIQSFFVVSQ